MAVFRVTLILCAFPYLTIGDRLPVVINTWDFIEAADQAWRVLHQPGKSGLDALVEGCTTCERLQCDGTVGFGGSPDERGETTLDAMIMDGATMNIGAVGALRQVKDAIKVARLVLEHTQHTLLVGDQATYFAEMMGFPKESLATQTSKRIWRNWWDGGCQPNFWVNVKPDPTANCGPYKARDTFNSASSHDNEKEKFGFGSKNHDTIGMIVISSDGHIIAGTSTNGASHKIPGRVGDSPIPGAGAYADNEVGAAAATGDGDIMMRFLPSFVAVENLRNGQDPTTAATGALERIIKFHPKFMGGLIVVNRLGEFGAACTGITKFPFSVAYGNDTKATIQYIDYLSWLPRRRTLIDIFRVVFGKAEYLAIEKSLGGKFYQNVVSPETKGLQEIFRANSSGMIEALELDGEHCFVAYKRENGVLSVYCVEFHEKGLQFIQKNELKRDGVIQIVSFEKDVIGLLFADCVEIWKPNESEMPKQTLKAVNPSQIAAVIAPDSSKFIAICSKQQPKTFSHGSVDIYRSKGSTLFEYMQTIEVVGPLQVEFAVLQESEDILLNVLTESFDEPLAIYEYKGIVGFQPIVDSSTVLPGNAISVIQLKASKRHLLAVMSQDDVTFIEMVLNKS